MRTTYLAISDLKKFGRPRERLLQVVRNAELLAEPDHAKGADAHVSMDDHRLHDEEDDEKHSL